MTTERALAVVRWIGEQYAVPLELLGELLAELAPADAGTRASRFGPVTTVAEPVAENRLRLARKHAARLESMGLLQRFRLVSGPWVAPTRDGLRRTGLAWEPWDVSDWQTTHIAAVARLRLHLQRRYPDARWESDRAIRSRWAGTGARVRRADGGLYWPEGQAVGVECELHVKQLDRYVGVVRDVDPAWSAGVWWFTPIAQVRLLQERLSAAGGGDHHQVVTAPEGVAV